MIQAEEVSDLVRGDRLQVLLAPCDGRTRRPLHVGIELNVSVEYLARSGRDSTVFCRLSRRIGCGGNCYREGVGGPTEAGLI